ncbi:interleukin-21 receptor-like [Cebidichthys violaceus]|uniref:interleukin-21 receptor-like n=1 Tax=Cebidichthys violaceus TaxID=271503 RepID=UPI0035CB70FA
MKGVQLLLACCCSSILAVTSCIRVDGFSCVSAYWDTVTCVLNITGNPVGQSNTTYSLKFIEFEGEVFSCPLAVMNHSYTGVCKVTDEGDLGVDLYDIELCHESACHNVTTDYMPRHNIQLTPPHQPEIHETPETVNVTWKSGYEDHMYLKSVLCYELLLQTPQSTETDTLKSLRESEWIPRSRLKPHTPYCIKVRSKPDHQDYNGIWSKWGPSTCWENKAGDEGEEEEDKTLVTLIISLGPVCVAVGVMLILLYRPAVRMKIKTLSHTPTPAPFFQPLFQQHGGNLQEWLSSQGKCVLTYKTEEILTTDAVIVVPRPVTKDPEENQVLFDPTVQPGLAQCQTSYIGLPAIHEASPPLAMVPPGQTSYTRLPCSIWGVGIEEVEVVSTLPEDFFNISSVDSGCSFLAPTESPECSLPNSPVDDSPPPCFCNDYCILNKTAGGFVPVLVSKGSSLIVPSDSPQEE